MRPVNLIPKEQQRGTGGLGAGRTGFAPYLVLGVLGLAVLGVAVVVLTSNSVNSKKEKVAQLERDTATAKASADVLRPYGSFAQVADKRLDTLNSLVATSFNWERVLRSLSRTIPSNVWLTQFVGTVSPTVKVEMEGGGAASGLRAKTNSPAIALVGCTYSHTAVARMMVRMRNLDDVSDVVLQSSEKTASTDDSAAAGAGGESGGEDCRTDPTIPKFEMLVVLAHDKTQAAAASVGATVAGPGANPVAAAQGAAATASSTSSAGTTP